MCPGKRSSSNRSTSSTRPTDLSANTMPPVACGGRCVLPSVGGCRVSSPDPGGGAAAILRGRSARGVVRHTNWALEGLRRLDRRGRFDTAGILSNTRSCRAVSDSVAWFAEEGIVT